MDVVKELYCDKNVDFLCLLGVGCIQQGCRCGFSGGAEEVWGDQDARQEENHGRLRFFQGWFWSRIVCGFHWIFLLHPAMLDIELSFSYSFREYLEIQNDKVQGSSTLQWEEEVWKRSHHGIACFQAWRAGHHYQVGWDVFVQCLWSILRPAKWRLKSTVQSQN